MSTPNTSFFSTLEIYEQLEAAYQYFNEHLFSNKLPPCLITVQREKNSYGYFSPLRWSNTKGEKTHEIALNPAYFAGRQLIEVFQTLVHEQCHLWQHEFGTPSRVGYHNKEWADLMASIGLMPSATGKPGGSKVGQKMADYPVIGGDFEKVCIRLIKTGFMLSWIDRRVAKAYTASKNKKCSELLPQDYLTLKFDEIAKDFDAQYMTARQRNIKLKIKYHCKGCGANVWGKKSLVIRCEKCQIIFTPLLPDQAETRNTVPPKSLAA